MDVIENFSVQNVAVLDYCFGISLAFGFHIMRG